MDKNKPNETLPEKKTELEVYDMISSEELEKLYQKNNHLLSQLSSSGRKNTILQSELYSVIEERSKLGIKNSSLTTEVTSLKETVSRFKNQEKKFYEQSLRLKKQLWDSQITTVQGNLSTQQLFKKQEKVFSEKLIRFLRYRQKVKQIHFQFKEQQTKQSKKIEALEQEINQLAMRKHQTDKNLPYLKNVIPSKPNPQSKIQQQANPFPKKPPSKKTFGSRTPHK